MPAPTPPLPKNQQCFTIYTQRAKKIPPHKFKKNSLPFGANTFPKNLNLEKDGFENFGGLEGRGGGSGIRTGHTPRYHGTACRGWWQYLCGLHPDIGSTAFNWWLHRLCMAIALPAGTRLEIWSPLDGPRGATNIGGGIQGDSLGIAEAKRLEF